MNHFANSPFEGELEVVSTLSDRVIQASLTEMRRQEDLTRALRDAMKMGVTIDELSSASGLRPSEIRRRVQRVQEAGELESLLVG